MSNGATLSVLGLYNYDNTLFDLMKYPTRFTTEDKQTTIGNILGECAEFEVLFPDIATFKNMIGLWSKLNFPTWERIYNLSLMEYNPIENYNRVETETITDNRTESRTGTETRTGTEEHTGTDTNRTTGNDTSNTSGTNTETNSGTDSEINKTVGYDANALQLHDSSDITHGHVISSNSSGNSTVTYGKQDSLTHGENIERGDEIERGEEIEHTGENVRTNETHGNIGVMSSQQMATQETELAPKLNVMSMIVESFKERFCIMVY